MIVKSLIEKSSKPMFLLLLFLCLSHFSFGQNKAASGSSIRSITIQTEPGSMVWLNDLRYGVTDAAGSLILKKVTAGRKTLRIRARGFAEKIMPLVSTQSGTVKVKLMRTTDEAELAFQEAEETREKATNEEMRKKAVELYHRAIKLRPRFPSAYVGLARVMLDLSNIDKALEAISNARRYRPIYPEASAVEGRIHRATADTAAAIESFKRAIREGRGVQAEAYTGLGLTYEDEGNYAETVKALEKAVDQLYDTEPVVYQLLGAAYEKLENYKKAIAAYERYLQLAPDGKLAPAIQSMIDQLKIQATGQNMIP